MTTTQTAAAAESLAATSNDGLLTTFAALTHRIHTAGALDRGARVVTADQITDAQHIDGLRTQRDMVKAEILRRMVTR